MITSKIAGRARTTIPKPVRAALRLKEGDEIAYAIEEGRVVLTRVGSNNADDPLATFNEWNGGADWKAYGRL
jgi:antitoxin PrlF